MVVKQLGMEGGGRGNLGGVGGLGNKYYEIETVENMQNFAIRVPSELESVSNRLKLGHFARNGNT